VQQLLHTRFGLVKLLEERSMASSVDTSWEVATTLLKSGPRIFKRLELGYNWRGLHLKASTKSFFGTDPTPLIKFSLVTSLSPTVLEFRFSNFPTMRKLVSPSTLPTLSRPPHSVSTSPKSARLRRTPVFPKFKFTSPILPNSLPLSHLRSSLSPPSHLL